MSNKEQNAYILGTDQIELHRLGLQHQVWSSEAIEGWRLAGFTAGHTLLDLGCGPGYCTTELAFIAGEQGKVIGVDKSQSYIDFLSQKGKQYGLHLEAQCADFDEMELQDDSIDGVYTRWSLAWIPKPEAIIKKLFKAMRSGGTIVTQEYYDWSTLQMHPHKPALAKAIAAALKSFKEQPGRIDIGRELPQMFQNEGFEIIGTRPLSKMARPHEFTWNWPSSFFRIYFPSLIHSGYLSASDVESAIHELEQLEQDPLSTILCPQMIEVIAKKP
jgi:ubiquinone/menaquinone biosynthesis C-methylase UbiE